MRFDCCLRIFGSRANTGHETAKQKGRLGKREEEKGTRIGGRWAQWVVQRQAMK